MHLLAVVFACVLMCRVQPACSQVKLHYFCTLACKWKLPFVMSPDPGVWKLDSQGSSVSYWKLLFLRSIGSLESRVPWIMKKFLLRSFMFACTEACRVLMVLDQVMINSQLGYLTPEKYLEHILLCNSGLGIQFFTWFFFSYLKLSRNGLWVPFSSLLFMIRTAFEFLNFI